jgi:nanoRNase/pAp phosphatase (c-di-AMP/oligoRNAs hydrolase)
MDYSSKLRRLLKGKKVLFLCHVHPDLDSLASAYSLSCFFCKKSKTTFGVPEPVPLVLKERLKQISLKPKTILSLQNFDTVVCVDFRSPVQAGSLSKQLEEFAGNIVIIDHHQPPSNVFSKKTATIIQPKAVATAQLVTAIGKKLSFSFNSKVSKLLAAAILEDSARFASATAETFEAFSFLMKKSRSSYDCLWKLAFPTMNPGKRLSLLKSFRNLELFFIGDFIFAFSKAPHQTASVANSMISLGADVAIGWDLDNDWIFSSIRVSNNARQSLNFNAAKMIHTFLESHKGIGGGHVQAAQLNIPSYFSENVIRDLAKRTLLTKVRKKQPKAGIRKR